MINLEYLLKENLKELEEKKETILGRKEDKILRESWESDVGIDDYLRLLEEAINIVKEKIKQRLFEAVNNNDVKEIENLVRNGAKIVINEKVNGLTPLHLVVANNSGEIVCVLLKNGANPEEKDDYGNNCFHYAAKRGNLEMLKLLANYTKDNVNNAINIRNQLGWSVLHSAAAGIINVKENWAVIGWLLERGADYNYKINNRFSKDLSVEDVLSQKDWSYAENYRRILGEFIIKKEKKSSNDLSLENENFEREKEKVLSELSEDGKEELDNLFEIQKELVKNPTSFLEKQLNLTKKRLYKEIEVEKIEKICRQQKKVIEIKENDLVAKLEVSPWGYFKR